MFKTYARICLDESDDDEAAAARLIAGGVSQPAVPTAVLTSTGVSRSRTQQPGVQQRRGGGSGSLGRAESTVAAPASSAGATTTTSTAASSGPRGGAGGSLGNLIDLGDDGAEPWPGSTDNHNYQASGRQQQRSRGRASPAPPAVELVTLQPQDPFLDLASAAAPSAAPRPPGPPAAPSSPPDGRQPQHPLDFLLGGGPTNDGRGASHAAASTSGGPQPPFPSFGSFSDLLRGVGAGPAAAASASAAPWVAASAGAGSGPSPSAGSNAWGSFAAASGPGTMPGWAAGAGASGGATHGSCASMAAAAAAAPPMTRGLHSHSTNGIDDLLVAHRAMREAAEGAAAGRRGGVGGGVELVAGADAGAPGTTHHSKPPAVQQADRSGGGSQPRHGPRPRPDDFDPFGPPARGSSASFTATTTTAAGAGAGAGTGAATSSSDGGAPPGGVRDASFVSGGGGGEGFSTASRELLLYAVPLLRDKLVFLPVVNWKEEEDTSTVVGKVTAGVSGVQQSLSNMWHSLKDKGEFSAKIYRAGQAILENLNAEERLMKNIPRKANKLVVHHPASIPPDDIQDQLTQLTASFCFKSVGKAAVAGVMLPVAVGLEVLAVPGIGWYTAYQLFKSTSAAAGGSRLNTYLKSDKSEVRVCYAPSPKMDLYCLKSRLSPDGVLGAEDIEDLCHDIREPALLHPLQELRNRHLRKTQTTKADYALLPMSAPDVDDQYGSGPTQSKKKD